MDGVLSKKFEDADHEHDQSFTRAQKSLGLALLTSDGLKATLFTEQEDDIATRSQRESACCKEFGERKAMTGELRNV